MEQLTDGMEAFKKCQDCPLKNEPGIRLCPKAKDTGCYIPKKASANQPDPNRTEKGQDDRPERRDGPT
jgi:hypothetical protein